MPVILIVDDVVENVRILKSLLQDFGQVVFARDGLEALAQVDRHHPDIVLLDVVMPGIDGYETCRRLKDNPATRDIPVIFITGADAESDEAKGLAAGAIDYITKPFAPAIVQARVRNHLALVRAHAELRLVNDALRKFKAAVESSSAAILITDRNARIEYVNEAFVGMTGFGAGEAIGQTPAILKNDGMPPETYRQLWETILGGNPWRGELRNQRRDGSLSWHDVAIAPVLNEAREITHFVAIHSDVTQRKQMEEELHRLAVTDGLTGVANRRRLIEVGNHELQLAQRSGMPVCALMLDIDHFKHINDSFGHPAGDAVLVEFASICASTVRSIDTVGRLGGEEFAVVLPMSDKAGAMQLAERLRASVAQSSVLLPSGQAIRFTVSIGVAQASEGIADFSLLLSMADEALYLAKHGGRNRVEACDHVAGGTQTQGLAGEKT